MNFNEQIDSEYVIQDWDAQEVKKAQAAFLTKVYAWMSGALVLTAVTAFFVMSSEVLMMTLLTNSILYWGLVIAELALVFALVSVLQRLGSKVMMLAFIVYSILTGVTTSVIFFAYTTGSIASTFFVTAGTFGAMSLYGYFTKRDLTTVGNIAFMGLIGVIIASIANLFMGSTILYWVTTYIGVLVFVALTAYDTQKIKQMAIAGFVDEESSNKGAIMGALALYLDFINLFLFLLRIFGGRR